MAQQEDVRYLNSIYDPSYGGPVYANVDDHENAAIDGVYAITVTGFMVCRIQDARRELKYTSVP
jgi:hypothetical protein